MPGSVKVNVGGGLPPRFPRIAQTRAHVYIAEQLRREITLGLLLTGDALPPERELAAMFGVARATVQEAVQLLQSEGLVETRRGRGGGTFVMGLPGDAMSRQQLISEVERNRDLIDEAVTYRMELEPAAAALAAVARTSEDLARLDQILGRAAKTTDDTLFTSLDTQFHVAVARASHNRFFAEAVEPVRLVLRDAIQLLPESSLWQQRSLREHARIFAALDAGDSEAARKAVFTHVGHTARSLRALLKAL